MGTTAAPVEVERPSGADEVEIDRPWVVTVWNDPINLMSYVTYVFQKLFGYPRPTAHRLMMQVHTEGRSDVAAGTRERCEYWCSRLHAHGLWATMRRD